MGSCEINHREDVIRNGSLLYVHPVILIVARTKYCSPSPSATHLAGSCERNDGSWFSHGHLEEKIISHRRGLVVPVDARSELMYSVMRS
ncbi:hypothetical protein MRB53_041446 [Persea americana]|nr:hypothetical protein MRB53_041446 [Persea americana]